MFTVSVGFRRAHGEKKLVLIIVVQFGRPVNFGYGTKSRNIPWFTEPTALCWEAIRDTEFVAWHCHVAVPVSKYAQASLGKLLSIDAIGARGLGYFPSPTKTVQLAYLILR